jgi:NAD(P)-dependent dehydrogenase (short-subunit alcohol dehydrogenase family)
MASPTVLITGASSGIGRACIDAFAARGWNVVATMRSPDEHREREQDASGANGAVRVARLDVTDQASIDAAFALAIETFGHVDCVVNNAGYGLTGVFEATDDATIQRQFDTNVFGVMRVTRAAIAHMRPRRSGTIVNVTSMGGRITFPLYSAYHASKFAVEGFSESLQYELDRVGIRVRIVEPGPIATDFYGRSMDQPDAPLPDGYGWAASVQDGMTANGSSGASPELVARLIVRAAQSRGGRLRWSTRGTARALLLLNRLLPGRTFRSLIRVSTMR